MSKSPAFQLYASDILVDCMQWDDAMIGLHIKLMCLQWVNVGIEIDQKSVPKGLTKKQKAIFDKIKHKYKIVNGKMYNSRLEEIREEQIKNSSNQSVRGKKGAEIRWHKHSASNGTSIAQVLPQAMPNTMLADSSSSSTSSSNIKKITVGLQDFFLLPSEWILQNRQMWFQVKMQTMFSKISPEKIFKKLDDEYNMATFTDENHIENTFKKVGKDVARANEKRFTPVPQTEVQTTSKSLD